MRVVLHIREYLAVIQDLSLDGAAICLLSTNSLLPTYGNLLLKQIFDEHELEVTYISLNSRVTSMFCGTPKRSPS